jgi:TPR repeat protein
MSNKSEEIAIFRKMANDGWLDSMYWLASALLISDDSNDRGDEAAKWLFMAIYLGHEKSKAALEFVNSTLGSERFNRAADEAIEWLGEKFNDFETNKDISKWSSELYELVKKNDDESKRRAAIKLVWNKP